MSEEMKKTNWKVENMRLQANGLFEINDIFCKGLIANAKSEILKGANKSVIIENAQNNFDKFHNFLIHSCDNMRSTAEQIFYQDQRAFGEDDGYLPHFNDVNKSIFKVKEKLLHDYTETRTSITETLEHAKKIPSRNIFKKENL